VVSQDYAELIGRLRKCATPAFWQRAPSRIARTKTDAELFSEAASAIEALVRERDAAVTLTEDQIMRADIALMDLYRGDGGWIGNKAAREQTMIVVRALGLTPRGGG
jgi:hypothetical protein